MVRRRPSAFEVSFPEEAEEIASLHDEQANSVPSYIPGERNSSTGPTSSLGKRKGEELGDPGIVKRQQLPKEAYYKKRKNELVENDKLVIRGEDPPDPEDNADEKPIRELHGFSIFDPKHRNELVTLEALELDDGVDREFEAAGMVTPNFISSEDEGQEDEPEQGQYVHLSAILRYTVDYTQDSEPFYIETQYAWYVLRTPSALYQPFYEYFYSPRRIAQIVVSWALRRPQDSFKSFIDRFTSKVDMFGRTYVEQHLWDSIVEVQGAIYDDSDSRKIMAVPFVKTMLRKAPVTPQPPRPPRNSGPTFKRLPKNKTLIGNIDLAVLKDENQNTTCVTPSIANLVKGLIHEQLTVLGSRLQPKPEVHNNLKPLHQLLKAKRGERKTIDYRKEDRVSVRSGLYTSVNIDGKTYSIGDVVLFPNPDIIEHVKSGKIHADKDSRIDHFFWFGQIKYINIETQAVHLRWFNHGSQTVIGELADPQELFLSDLCGHESLHGISGKVTVHIGPDSKGGEHDVYFCKFMHDTTIGSFTSIDTAKLDFFASQTPPNNCPGCTLQEERDLEIETRELKDEFGNLNGVAFATTRYHLHDFVLYRADKGPAHIGYIINISLSGKNRVLKVTLNKVGRIGDLGSILPEDVMKDERHLFLSKEEIPVPVRDLLNVIYVPSFQSFEAPEASLEDWIGLSPDHFYVRYIFPTLKVKSWKDRKSINHKDLKVCSSCLKERMSKRREIYNFLAESQRQPLSVLDVFGGVGAFSRGLADGSGCLKVTHAIEIGPSAARTFQRNHPDVTVYNQCANEILRYAVKSQQGHEIEIPKQKFDDKTLVPAPPKPGEIQVITAGFPCQSHSSLNMYKKTDDVKSNLILTALSYVDHYSPLFTYFENVPGFLKFSLNATQANEHKAVGEIEMGGLKLVVRALIDLNYQVQFGLLQAAQYGTPQRRLRFFLVAAKHGHVLPELPQPTHDFPDSKIFNIKYSEKGEAISPIRMAHGTALHPVVTIEDAIGDLPRFDWKHPKPLAEKSDKQKERRRRQNTVPSVECKTSEPYSGFKGQKEYHQKAKTRYQQSARVIPTTDIQQYTKCLLPKKVERVLNIPLEAGADYKNLPPSLHEWQFVDPTSSVGKLNYRKGIYGRLDKLGVFPTTVTNVDPTAKQSQVLHPWCYRMVTVRELARSQGFPDDFVFEAIGNNVVTMHRQIGNAVPLPVAHALGRELRESLYNRWLAQRESAIVID